MDLAIAGTITANGGSVILPIEDNPAVGIEIAGTWTGTLVVQATIDGSHWFTPIVQSPTSAAGTSSFTSNGRTIAICPGAAALQVIATATVTGTAVIVLRAGNATGAIIAAGLEVPTTLTDLSDVTITTPAAKQVPRYSGSAWVNSQLALNDLSDVNVSTPAQGAIAYRGASVWNALAAGTAGQVLQSGGAAANPSWLTVALNSLSDVLLSGVAQGDIAYRGASKWNNLAPGAAGQVLTSGGAAANPSWATPKKRACTICVLGGFTPASTGGDAGEFPIPFDPSDGVSSITWNVRRLTLRVAVAGGAPAATFEVSTASTGFSAATIGTVTLGSGAYQASNTTSLGTVASGNLVRINPTTLGTATGWTATIELEATN